jgi:predicted DNA-binding protein
VYTPRAARRIEHCIVDMRVDRPVYHTSAVSASTTVRVSRETRERLARLAKASGLTTAELIAELTRRAEEDTLLDRMNAHYQALHEDPEAWEAHVDERERWDATLLDGLEREP